MLRPIRNEENKELRLNSRSHSACDKPASVEPCHSTRVTYDSRSRRHRSIREFRVSFNLLSGINPR